MTPQRHLKGRVMITTFKARQRLKAMQEEYRTMLYDNDLPNDEHEDVVGVYAALGIAIEALGEEN